MARQRDGHGNMPPGDLRNEPGLPESTDHMHGFGAGKADMRRGYKSVKQPEKLESAHPQREGWMDFETSDRGFVSRSPFSDER